MELSFLMDRYSSMTHNEAYKLRKDYTKSFKESGHEIKKECANTITVPINFILGEYEILCDPRSLSGHFPKAKISIIDNAGHMAPIEQSQKFNQLVVDMMQ